MKSKSSILKRKKSSKENSSKPRKSVKIDDLKWRAVEIPDTLDNYEGFYGLEEIDGVEVKVAEDGKITFNADEVSEEDGNNNEYKSPFPEEDLENLPKSDDEDDKQEQDVKNDKELEKLNKKKQTHKSTQMNKKLIDVDFTQLSEENNEDEEYPDVWGLGLSLPIRKALSKMSFDNPTEIQKEAIPEMLLHHDVIGKAATGSGKTLAYGLPIIQRHLQLEAEEVKKWPTGVIFGPTRELVHQISNHLRQIANHCALSVSGVVPITGGLSIQKQARQLQRYPSVVVATPGRFLELLQSSNEITNMFRRSEILVLDEADRVIQDGHFEEMEKILDIMGRGKRQTCVFSATFDREFMFKLTSKKRSSSSPNKKKNSQDIINILKEKLEFRQEPVFIDANPAAAIAAKVTETVIECGAMEKDLFLYYFCLLYPARTMVFVNSIDAVKRITPLLKELGLDAFGLHSDMIQKQRLRSLERFKDHKQGILIATDVAARGLDIPSVDHVVHYHVPRSADMYVHRSGRTARAGHEGISVVLCSPDEAAPLVKLQKLVGNSDKLDQLDIDYDMAAALKSRVTLAKKITESVTVSTKSNDWLKQAAEDLGADLDELEEETAKKSGAKSKKANQLTKDELRAAKYELKELLAKPVGIRSTYVTSGAVNMAQMMLSGDSHKHFLGQRQTTALQSLRK